MFQVLHSILILDEARSGERVLLRGGAGGTRTTEKQSIKPKDEVKSGEGGIRTPDTVSRIAVFETAALNQLGHLSISTTK